MQLPRASKVMAEPDSERVFIADYGGSKAAEVLNVPELAEHILSFLDIKSIIKTTRVCRQLKGILDSIQKLRTMAFLAPVPQKVALKSMPSRIIGDPEEIGEENQHLFNSITNPLFFHRPEFSCSKYIYAGLRFDNNLLTGPSVDFSYLCLESSLKLYITKPQEYRTILQVKRSSARNIVLAYQPESIALNLEIEHTLKGRPETLYIAVRVAAHITAGGLVDIVNLTWKCSCDLAQEWGKDIAKETIEKMAKRRGNTVVQWMGGDVSVTLPYRYWD